MIGLANVLLAATLSLLPGQAPSFQSNAEISGTVKDAAGANIAGATVEFIGQSKHYAFTVGNDGKYGVQVTPGTYSVTARATNFCEGHRAMFYIAANQKGEFDFVLPVKIEASDTLEPQDPGCYKEDSPDMGKSELHPLVLYGARRKRGDETSYSSLKRRYLPYRNGSYEEESYPAVFSYGLLTLQAGRLVFDPRTKSITAIGDVILQNGAEKQRASKITVEFAKGEPTVSVVE